MVDNISRLTNPYRLYDMLFPASILNKALVIIAILIGILFGFLGSNIVTLPNVFFTESVGYPITLWLILVDITAIGFYKMGRELAKQNLIRYSRKDEFKKDYENGRLSRKRFSRAVYDMGNLMILAFLFSHSFSYMGFSFYYWSPIFESGFVYYIGVLFIAAWFEFPLFAIPFVLSFFIGLDDIYKLVLPVTQSLVQHGILRVELNIKVQSKKGDPIEDVTGRLVYIGDELIIKRSVSGTDSAYITNWKNVESYSIVIPALKSTKQEHNDQNYNKS
jgi:hypothetical protein